MKGFKYRANLRGENGLYRDMESLIKDELYAARFDDLNDPFEAMTTQSFGDAINFLKEVGLDKYGPLQEIFQKITSFRDRAGVYSLAKSDSGVPDNELMWAHYANAHKGFCIEYDVEAIALSEELWFNVNQIDSVVYSTILPEMALEDLFGKSDVSLLTKIFGTKSKVWSYENEARLLYETYGLKKYNPAALKAVYFGLNMAKAQEDYLIEGLKNRNVMFYKMRMADREYRLIAETIAVNVKNYKYSLHEDTFEIILTDHNKAVENFHVCYKHSDTSEDTLLNFIRAFRERFCTRPANVSLYNINNDYLKSLIKIYPLQGEQLEYMRNHFLAASFFEMEDQLWLNLYD